MGKPSKKQMGVALPPDLRDRLQAAADAADHSVASEIRLRLAHSFQAEAGDTATAEFASKVAWLAEQIKRDKGFDWHTHIKAFEAFTEAVNAALERRKPPEHTGMTAASDLFWGDDDPKTLGRSVERHHVRWAAEVEKHERELRQRM